MKLQKLMTHYLNILFPMADNADIHMQDSKDTGLI